MFNEADCRHCKFRRLCEVADETMCQVLRLGKLLQLVIELLVGSSDEESFHNYLHRNHEYGCIEASSGMPVRFFKKRKEHFLLPFLNETF